MTASTPLNIAFIKARWHASIVDKAFSGFQSAMDAGKKENENKKKKKE